MRTQPLSPATRDRLNAVFAPSDRAEAERPLVSGCGSNLPLCQDCGPCELERVRYVALKLSQGTLRGLRRAIDLAQRDGRDSLMAAGFGEDATEQERGRPSGSVG